MPENSTPPPHSSPAKSPPAWKANIAPAVAVLVGIGMFAGMFAFQFFKGYMVAVLSHWVALMSGGVSVLITFYQQIRKNAGKYVLYVVAAMCVFFAGFQAWQDQYKENAGGRDAGTFVLQGLPQTRYKLGVADNSGSVQLWLNFASIQNKLITYNFDTLSMKSGTLDSASSNVTNRGGYAYPSTPASYALGWIPEPDISMPVYGTLEYKVSYHVEGSNVVHHTTKSMNFACFKEQPACRYSILSEHED
jgi:hypothetical protein